MGYSISWLAVRRKSTEIVLQQLKLSRTGELGDYADYPVVGRIFPNGWFLLVADKSDHELVGKDTLATLSAGCEIVACSVEEHGMVCWSERWVDGANIWRLEHDAQRSILDIKRSGSPPAEFEALAAGYADRQRQAGGKKANVDYYFEIPLEMAKSIVGFKHDEDNAEVADGSFEILVASAKRHPSSVNKPWWRLW